LKIVLLGPPGAGKGTQAKMLAEKLNVPHISTGEMLRDAVAAQSDLGKRVKEIMDRGELVPDDVMVEVVKERLSQPDAKDGFILDGFPRTVAQAEALEKMLAQMKRPLDAVVELDVGEDEIIRRLSGRWVCSSCGANFHTVTRPPIEAGKCDYCGSPLIQRDDDKPEAISRRLQVYRAQTQPLIDYYRERRLLRTVNGRQGVEKTLEAISEVLGIDARS
jgi:adenylate kinase